MEALPVVAQLFARAAALPKTASAASDGSNEFALQLQALAVLQLLLTHQASCLSVHVCVWIGG